MIHVQELPTEDPAQFETKLDEIIHPQTLEILNWNRI